MQFSFSKRKVAAARPLAALIVALAITASARPEGSSVTVESTVLVAQVAQAGGSGQGNGKDPKGSFGVAGEAQGLYPGAVVPLPVSLTNPQSFGIRVTQLTVAVQAPVLPSPPLSSVSLAPPCTAAAVEVGVLDGDGQFTERHPIPVSVALAKDGTASLPSTIQLRMAPDSPDACQGATFPLSYGGSAVKS